MGRIPFAGGKDWRDPLRPVASRKQRQEESRLLDIEDAIYAEELDRSADLSDVADGHEPDISPRLSRRYAARAAELNYCRQFRPRARRGYIRDNTTAVLRRHAVRTERQVIRLQLRLAA